MMEFWSIFFNCWLHSANAEEEDAWERAPSALAACSRRQARGRLFLYLRESPENARATGAAAGSSATSRPNCAASVRPDEIDRGRSSRSAILLLTLDLLPSERHNAGKCYRVPVRGVPAVLPVSAQPASAGRYVPE